MPPSFHTYTGHPSVTATIVVVCSAISLFNALELLLLILTTFRTYRGPYFSSLVAASTGIILYVVGFLFEYFRLAPEAVGISVDTVGWMLMVTGQSVVLYSRLGIVMGEGRLAGGGRRKVRVLRAVKWMIIVDAVVFHGMTTVVVFGAHFGPPAFYTAYDYIEKIQMTVFTVQEFILSGLYIYQTLQILRSRRSVLTSISTGTMNSNASRGSSSTARIMYQLFGINVVIIALDIGLLVVEYLDLHVMEQTIKGVTYSVKLKLEFAILSKLVELTRPMSSERTSSGNGNDTVRMGTVDTVREGRPRWLEEVDKDGVEHVERVYSRGRGGEEGADVLYADALRSLDR